jgi:AraC-like DNA-binding protein
VSYRERPTAVPGVVLWERTVERGSPRTRILPDGCLDVIWDGRRLFVAGPDSTARWHEEGRTARYVGIRCSGGRGPALLGVPADEMRDRTLDLSDVSDERQIRALTERTATDPVPSLEAWLVDRAASWRLDPVGPRVVEWAGAGAAVSKMAGLLGLTTRQLHRRCLSAFGYGPRHLTRVLRLSRALEAARESRSLARVSALSGYADQAHLCREVRDLVGTTPALLLGELGLR